jgi:UDP-3-O-[3-hydroxymyristoyl] glucosamine N-acyltransferase
MKLDDILSYIKPIIVDFTTEVVEVEFKSIDDVNFDSNSICWCSDKNLDILLNIKIGTVLLSEKGNEFCTKNSISSINKIVVEHPRKTFAAILNHFIVKKEKYSFISPSAYISDSTKFTLDQVSIGHNVVIEDNVELGKKVSIGANTVIKEGTIIKNDVKIGSNCTIGGIGFGYEQNEEGEYELIPHIGVVYIDDNVEIGNNVCIDRAVLGFTRLSKNVKVDNLVHIAHGVQVGENSLVIANAMVAGSVKIGKNVWVAPSSSIRQKLTIEDNSTIGMGSVVVKNVGESDVVAGVPAKKIN